MALNVKPLPTLDDDVNEIRLRTAEIINPEILPNAARLWGCISDSANAPTAVLKEARELRHDIQNKVEKANLWAPQCRAAHHIGRRHPADTHQRALAVAPRCGGGPLCAGVAAA
jgi:hypothetical protein